MSNDAEYLKKVIREDLLIELDHEYNVGTHAVVVSLRFKSDKKVFAAQTIFLPEGG